MLVSFENVRFPAGLDIPDYHRLIGAGRSQVPPVRAKRHAINGAGVSAERSDAMIGVLIEGTGVPDPYGSVVAGRGQALPVRAEQDAPHQVLVGAQSEHFATGRCFPQAHVLVQAGRGEALAVGAERHADDPDVPRERVQELLTGDVVHPHAAIRNPPPHGQVAPIRTERRAPNANRDSGQGPWGS